MPNPPIARPASIENAVRGPTQRLAQSRRKGLAPKGTDEVTLKRYLASTKNRQPLVPVPEITDETSE